MSHPKVEKDWPASDAYVFRSANSTAYLLSDSVQISIVQVIGFVQQYFKLDFYTVSQASNFTR